MPPQLPKGKENKMKFKKYTDNTNLPYLLWERILPNGYNPQNVIIKKIKGSSKYVLQNTDLIFCNTSKKVISKFNKTYKFDSLKKAKEFGYKIWL
tara:strand:- start:72 stop:356 length:285 start_codon:yes stop_codon:yes gene_type:complete